MPGSSFGKALILTTFGESHGPAVGGVIDGFPSNIEIDPAFIQSELNRRKTGGAFFTSSRKEEDHLVILSGIFGGKSTGAPLAFIVYNKDQHAEDYAGLQGLYRPSHADFTYEQKYGVRDPRGGGRASARETLARVAGGALAKIMLKRYGISFTAFVNQIGNCRLPDNFRLADSKAIADSPVGCPDPATSNDMKNLLERLKKEGDTAGGVITCYINGMPAGLGEPVFDKLQADLAKAMLSINGAKGFEYGSGFAGAAMKGSEHNDPFVLRNKKISTSTNFSGGIQGGISNGNEIYFRVAFKPVPTLMKEQVTVNRNGEKVILKGKGRHDVCFVPRALVIVEAMAALVIADHFIRHEGLHKLQE